MDVRLHRYHPTRPLLLLEYIPSQTAVSPSSRQHQQRQQHDDQQPPNVLLFIGGMYDNFRSPAYVDDLAALFPRDVQDRQKWSVFHVQLSSAAKGFGIVSLDRDVEEISHAISYIRTSVTKKPSTPVVIMGHSTGCQDSMHYLCSPLSQRSKIPRPQISGIILQAPVSDREAMLDGIRSDPAAASAYQSALALCAATPEKDHSATLLPWKLSLPVMGPVPMNLSRFLSLASPGSPANPAPDDYFSSDLGDEVLRRSFGKLATSEHVLPARQSEAEGGDDGSREAQSPPVSKSILVLISGSDEHVPASIDKADLLRRWTRAVAAESKPSTPAIVSPHSQVVRNALHDISGTSVDARTARLVDMRAAVLRYLNDVVGHVDGGEGDGQEQGDHDVDVGMSPWGIWRSDRDAIEAEKGVGGVKL